MKRNISYNLVLNKHVKPQNSEDFGYWLAGLIDADGHIAKKGDLQITFNSRDLCAAVYIKKVIGFGGLYEFKRVQAYDYRCTNKQGLNVISKLILSKLKLPSKINQFNERLAPRLGYFKICQTNESPVSIDNHWFAGFVQGDGSFQIRIRQLQKRSKNHQIEITLNIELKQECILKQIKATFGGFVGYRKSRDTYYYNSINLTNATKLVAYFDKYQVIGPSYRLYLCWKRALNIVKAKEHLTTNGFEVIKALKAYMTQLRA